MACQAGSTPSPPSGRIANAEFTPDTDIDPFFDAVVQGVEEAILNALVANDDKSGRDGNFVPALPKTWLRDRFGMGMER